MPYFANKKEVEARRASPTSLDYTDTYDRLINQTYNNTVGRYKLIKSGSIYEVYEFQFPVRNGKKTAKRKNSPTKRITHKVNPERQSEYSQKRATRARNTVRRLAQANFSSADKFLTLTFAENMTEIDFANKEFQKFIKRIKRRYGNLKYITAIEFQKRGAVHYHTLINLPYIEHEFLEELWRNGFVFVRALDGDKPVTNVGAYISKYMSKDNLDDRLSSKKCYFTSRGLIRPTVEYLDQKTLDEIVFLHSLDDNHQVFTNSYSSNRNGKVIYKQFDTAHDLRSSGGRS